MNSPIKHMNEMLRTVGMVKAIQIAERAARNTDITQWDSIPKGQIHFPTDKRGKGDSTKYLKDINTYWVNALGYLVNLSNKNKITKK